MIKTKNNNEICCITNEDYNGVLIIGVFHGDEPQGKYIIEEYLKQKKTKLAFIPCLNPDGMQLNQRTNANGVDLNRNFPTRNWQLTKKDNYYGGNAPASEIETKFLINKIEELKPNIILTLHAPYKIVNYDGDALDIAKKISKIIGYPVENDIGYPTPGSFGTWAGIENGIKTITLELDEEIDIDILKESVFNVFKMLEEYK